MLKKISLQIMIGLAPGLALANNVDLEAGIHCEVYSSVQAPSGPLMAGENAVSQIDFAATLNPFGFWASEVIIDGKAEDWSQVLLKTRFYEKNENYVTFRWDHFGRDSAAINIADTISIGGIHVAQGLLMEINQIRPLLCEVNLIP